MPAHAAQEVSLGLCHFAAVWTKRLSLRALRLKRGYVKNEYVTTVSDVQGKILYCFHYVVASFLRQHLWVQGYSSSAAVCSGSVKVEEEVPGAEMLICAAFVLKPVHVRSKVIFELISVCFPCVVLLSTLQELCTDITFS